MFRFVKQVFTVSTNTLAEYRRRFPQDQAKFGFIPTWVDRSVFSPATRPRRQIRAQIASEHGIDNVSGAWILFAARLQRQKAPERLIESFRLIKNHRPDAELLIAGDGNMRAEVEAMIRESGLGNCVHLLGSVSQKDLLPLYQSADLMLLTSSFEGMPMGVLEALACGLPVVSTDVGEVSRVVLPGITGELASGFSGLAIAEKAVHVLCNPDLYTTQACIESVTPYSPEAVLQPVYARIASLAGSCVENRSGGRHAAIR